MRLRCPNGHEDRFYEGESTGTLIGWQEIVDADGRVISQDPNTYRTTYTCVTCGAKFDVIRRHGKSRFSYEETVSSNEDQP